MSAISLLPHTLSAAAPPMKEKHALTESAIQPSSYSVQRRITKRKNFFFRTFSPPSHTNEEKKKRKTKKIGPLSLPPPPSSSLLGAAPLPLRRGDEARRHHPPAPPGAGRDPPRNEEALLAVAAAAAALPSSFSFSLLGHLARERRGRAREQVQRHKRQDRREVDRATERGDDASEQVQIRVGERRQGGDDGLRRLRPPREEQPADDRSVVEGQERRDARGEDDLGRGVARDQSGEAACVQRRGV